jgi:hypothetical protein
LLSDCIVGIKEFKAISWEEKLAMAEEYIKEYGKLPTSKNKDIYIRQIGAWILRQKQNYKSKKQIMKKEEIRIIWGDFVEKYQELFMTPNEVWLENKNNVEEYILKFNKLPTKHSEETDVSILGSWVSTQKQNYKSKKNTIMVNEEIRTEWKDFIEKYKEVFKPRVGEEVWMNHFQKVKEYIQKYNMRPSKHSDNKYISSLGSWVSCQKQNYKSKKQIMEKKDIRKEWCDLTSKYPHLF